MASAPDPDEDRPSTPSTAPSPSSPKGTVRRAQILAEMIRLIGEHGVDASSLRTVASGLGLSQAALRHYFPTRDDLLVAVYREYEEHVVESNDPLLSAVDDMRASADRNRTVPGLVQLYTALAAAAVQDGHPVARDFIRARFRALRAELADVIRRDQRQARLRDDLDAEDLASLVMAASDGLQVQWLLDPDQVDAERVLRVLGTIMPASGPRTDQ
ncbi:TetR/AcrR family transcriptional regulator [Curtobacterium sp. RRHDQ10]|uniref:TetR/AcrR family transcriptional regulator n=1 Tax=Curtobacterium phyllosphaerae TaxID=3413379 RepID=UPI003BF41E06